MISQCGKAASDDPSSSRVLEAVLGASEDAIVVVASDGSIVMWNPASEALLGYATNEIIGAHVKKILPEQWHDRWEKRLEEIRDGEIFRGVSARRHKNGALVDVFVSSQSVRTLDGEFAGYLLVLKDQKKKAQQELTNELLASILRSAPGMPRRNASSAVKNIKFSARHSMSSGHYQCARKQKKYANPFARAVAIVLKQHASMPMAGSSRQADFRAHY
jgi:PAS domain S-box-containing protein